MKPLIKILVTTLLVSAGWAAQAGQKCSGGTAYLHTPGTDGPVPLLSRADSKSPPVVQAHDMQYVCLLTAEPVSQGQQQWVQVAITPLLKGAKPFKVSVEGKDRLVNHFPDALPTEKTAAACTLSPPASDDETGLTMDGSCPIGWVLLDAVRYVGD